jgi:outer membrane immunogenic protein
MGTESGDDMTRTGRGVGIAAFAFAAFMGGAAIAADMPVKAPYLKAPAASYSWTGCYLGGYVGGSTDGGGSRAYDPHSTVAPFGSYNGGPPTPIGYGGGFTGGGTLGCNYQFAGTPIVVGAEGEYGYLHMTTSFPWPGGPGNDTVFSGTLGNWYGVAAGRIGVVNDRVMFYAKGGAAWSQVSSAITDNCTAAPCGPATLNAVGNLNLTGWAAGGGIEWAAFGNWSVKAEALYLGFEKSYAVCGPETPSATTFCSTHNIGGVMTAKIGLNYKFDWGGPVVAKY